MKMDVITLEGKKAGSVDLADSVFAAPVRSDLLHRAVNWQMSRMRQGSANTKGRAEINRTGAKWFRQKGTGRARHGSRRANLFVGGGVTFGPKPRDFSIKLPKKVRNLALKTALSSKVAEKKMTVLDTVDTKSAKTKDLASQLDKLSLSNALFLVDSHNENFDRASRNLPHVKVVPTEGANVYDILRADNLVMTKEAAALLTARLTGEAKTVTATKKEA